MTSNNSAWIKGAPKEAIACIWDRPKSALAHAETIALNLINCRQWIKWRVPCYRHKPIKNKAK